MKRTWIAVVMALASVAFAGQAFGQYPRPVRHLPAPASPRSVLLVYYPSAPQVVYYASAPQIVATYQIDGVGYPVDSQRQAWGQNQATGQWFVFAVIVSGPDGEFAVYSDGSQTSAFRVQ